MILVRIPIHTSKSGTIPVKVSRETLAKKRWRGVATEGTEFGFDLDEPLTDGAVVHVSSDDVYVVSQMPERLLEVALDDPREAARLGWKIGNLHFVIEVTRNAIRVPDDVAVRQMFEREGIRFGAISAVFQPLSGGGHHQHSI